MGPRTNRRLTVLFSTGPNRVDRSRSRMRPARIPITVPNSREDVYRILDVLANHEQFTNHMLVDWPHEGPPSGVGARARVRLQKPGRADWLDLGVIDAHPPQSSTEESVSAGGRAVPTGSTSCRTAAPESPSSWRGSRHL
jgi:hypothetical protein